MITYPTLIKSAVILLLIIIILTASQPVYYKLYPFQPIINLNSPFPVTKESVSPGDEISWNVKFCKSDSTPAHTKAILITRMQQVKLYESDFNADRGCQDLIRTIKIPLVDDLGRPVAKGDAEIDFYTNYDYPFNRVIPVRGRTTTFAIK